MGRYYYKSNAALVIYTGAERGSEESTCCRRSKSNNSDLFLSGGYCGEDEFLSAKTIKKKSHRYRTCGILYLCEFKLPDFGKSSTVSNEFVTDPHVLVNNVSFSHIREIMVLNDAFERFFYETECMKCNWNVRWLHTVIMHLLVEL